MSHHLPSWQLWLAILGVALAIAVYQFLALLICALMAERWHEELEGNEPDDRLSDLSGCS